MLMPPAPMLVAAPALPDAFLLLLLPPCVECFGAGTAFAFALLLFLLALLVLVLVLTPVADASAAKSRACSEELFVFSLGFSFSRVDAFDSVDDSVPTTSSELHHPSGRDVDERSVVACEAESVGECICACACTCAFESVYDMPCEECDGKRFFGRRCCAGCADGELGLLTGCGMCEYSSGLEGSSG